MVFLEQDPITAEGVSRTTLEEEEEQAEALVDQYSVAPTIEVGVCSAPSTLCLHRQHRVLVT